MGLCVRTRASDVTCVKSFPLWENFFIVVCSIHVRAPILIVRALKTIAIMIIYIAVLAQLSIMFTFPARITSVPETFLN